MPLRGIHCATHRARKGPSGLPGESPCAVTLSKPGGTTLMRPAETPRLRSTLLPCPLTVGFAAGDARQFVDQRYNGPDGPPEIQVRGDHDTGQGVDHYHVEHGRVEGGAEVPGSSPLLPGRSPAGHDLLYIYTPASKARYYPCVVQVAAGLAARLPHRDERDFRQTRTT